MKAHWQSSDFSMDWQLVEVGALRDQVANAAWVRVP
jgi:hypothetical protein